MTQPERNVLHRGSGRVGFLACQTEITEMLAAGHPKIAVFEAFGDRLNIRYSQFNKYVARYIGAATLPPSPSAPATGTPALQTKEGPPAPRPRAADFLAHPTPRNAFPHAATPLPDDVLFGASEDKDTKE